MAERILERGLLASEIFDLGEKPLAKAFLPLTEVGIILRGRADSLGLVSHPGKASPFFDPSGHNIFSSRPIINKSILSKVLEAQFAGPLLV